MKSAIVAVAVLLSSVAQAHTIVDPRGVGFPVPECADCGTVKFSGGAHHSNAVRMTITVGSGAQKGIVDQNFLYVAFRLDSFAPNATDTICTFQLERGPGHPRTDPMTGSGAMIFNDWPADTVTAGYYEPALGAYVAQIRHPDVGAFRVGEILSLSAMCPARDR